MVMKKKKDRTAKVAASSGDVPMEAVPNLNSSNGKVSMGHDNPVIGNALISFVRFLTGRVSDLRKS